MSSALFDVFVHEGPAAPRLDELQVFLDVDEVHVNPVNLLLPLKGVKAGLDDLVLLGFLKQCFLLLELRGVEEVDLGLFDLAHLSHSTLTPGVRRHQVATDHGCFVAISLDYDPVELLGAVEVRVVLSMLFPVKLILLLLLMHWLVELVLSAVQLDVEQLVNQVADHFSVPLLQVLWFAVTDCLGPELL